MKANSKYKLNAPQDAINFIEQYYDYLQLVTTTMYKLKNTPLLNAELFVDTIVTLRDKAMIFNNESIVFFDISELDSSISLTNPIPTEYIGENLHINVEKMSSVGTIFHGNVAFDISKSLLLNHTSFNKDAVVTINGRQLMSDELESISGNIFELCTANITFDIETLTVTKPQLYEAFGSLNNLRDIAKQYKWLKHY